jgi:hypothetical protein
VRFVVARKIPTPRLEVAAVQFAPLSVEAAGIVHGEDSRLIAEIFDRSGNRRGNADNFKIKERMLAIGV